MRTHFYITHAHGQPIHGYRDLIKDPLADSTMTELAANGLVQVTYVYKNGQSVEYTAIEYQCEWCGSYEHRSEACPELEDQEGATDSIDCPNCTPDDRNDCVAPEGH